MIIKVLDQRYKSGCNKGTAKFTRPGLLYSLNSIIEWDKCEFPQKVVETVEKELSENTDESPTTITVPIVKEQRDFLGEDPELVPGNCFLVNGQVIAVDSDKTLILVLSETGRKSLDRFIDEILDPELNLVNKDTLSISNLIWEDLSSDTVDESEFDRKIIVPYPKYKIWKDKFINNRNLKVNSFGKHNILVTVKTYDLLMPVTLILREWDVLYKSSDFEEDEVDLIEDIIELVLSYFYKAYDRVLPPKEPEKTKEEQIEEFLSKS